MDRVLQSFTLSFAASLYTFSETIFFYDWKMVKRCCLWRYSGLNYNNYMAIPWNSNGSGIAMGSAAMPRCQKRDFAATGCSSGIDSELRQIATSRAKTSEKTHFWRVRGYVSKPWQPWMFMSQNDPKCMFPQKSGELALEQNDQNLQYSIELVPSKPRVRHTQTTHPNNMIYLSPKDEWKHWLYAVILTFSFQDLGF